MMLEAWALMCLGLMVLPGPDMALVTSYALRGKAWPVLAGLYASFLLYSLLILAGLLALLAKWPEWSDWARVIGGLYLIYLSIRGLLSLRGAEEEYETARSASLFGPAFGVMRLTPNNTFFFFYFCLDFCQQTLTGQTQHYFYL